MVARRLPVSRGTLRRSADRHSQPPGVREFGNARVYNTPYCAVRARGGTRAFPEVFFSPQLGAAIGLQRP